MPFKVWQKSIPFHFYATLAFVMGAAALAGGGPSKTGILLLLFLGFLSWGLIEYGLHRFIFHYDAHSVSGRKFIQDAHLNHHENPKSKDDLFASLRLSVPIAAAYWLLAWGILGTWQAAAFLFIGLVACYLCYEWLHLQAHHGKSRLPVLRYLKKYHLLHHYRTPEMRFGVTSPVYDLIFGTFRSAADRRSAIKR